LRSILITGGAGFAGSHFVRLLLAAEPEARVVTLDLLTYAGSRDNLRDLPDPSRHTFVQGDINDAALLDELFARHEFDALVNFAAESHVDRSILGPGAFLQANVNGAFQLLEAARRHWTDPRGRRFLQVSTDEVFGELGPDDPPWDESSPYAPRSPYAASKAAADHLALAYHHTYGLEVLLGRCSNLYGPYQHPEKLIPLVIERALSGQPVPLYGDGQQMRDWLYVEDGCAGLLAVLRAGRPGQAYNLGGGHQPTNEALVRRICDLLDGRLPGSPHRPFSRLIRRVADRPGHDRRYALDTARARAELGWRPRVPLEEGLNRTVDWYLQNRQWVEARARSGEHQAWLRQNYSQRESED